MHKLILRINVFIYLLIAPFVCPADNSVSTGYIDGITLTITNKTFDPENHEIKKCKHAVCIIDDKYFYGGNGKTPEQKVDSLVYSKNGKQIQLNVSSMYGSGITSNNMKERFNVQSWGGGAYRVIGYFGKGKISYIGQWLVRPEGSIRNHLSDYESLVSLIFEVKKDHNFVQ